MLCANICLKPPEIEMCCLKHNIVSQNFFYDVDKHGKGG